MLNIFSILENCCYPLSAVVKVNSNNFFGAQIFLNHIKSCLSEILFYLSYMLGKDANPQERKAAMKTAEEFLQQMNYSTNTQVCVERNWLKTNF